jgi:ribonuclease P protein component
MRLASPEVKRLLAHGQRASLGVGPVTLLARSLPSSGPEDSGVPTGGPSLESGAADALAPNSSGARLAIAAPKKRLKRAVDRNLVKRVSREALRQHAVRAEPIDVLLILTASTPRLRGRQARQSVRSAVDGLLSRLQTREQRKRGHK